VYQTNHGCAQDLAETGTANPAGQILSLAMLLRESFALERMAILIENALAATWREGWRTADLAEPGCEVINTPEFTGPVVGRILQSPEWKQPDEACAAAG